VTRPSAPDVAFGLRPGDVVGSYTVECALGAGAMARVYKAHGPHGEVVALKLVRQELATENTFRRRFAREVRTAVRVEHPHLLPMLESGEHEGVPYMAQPFVRGGSLQDKLDREGRLDLDFAVTVCLEVAEGVGALHEQSLIHRDLKPANILLDEHGRAFVADFGLAKDPHGSLITKPGQAVGTVDYMAPEQIRGEAVAPTADVYSLGCVMFACLAGRPPFANPQLVKVLRAHLGDEPPDLRAMRPGLPEELARAVTRALEKDPADRPETATAYARMLQGRRGMSELRFIEETPVEGRELPATPGMTIGRAGCDVELNDPEVSRRHAVLRRVDAGLALEDLDSTNGTFVNERRISGIVEIAAGDRIRFGNTVWRLVHD
jgi:serine/threonine protein kinase